MKKLSLYILLLASLCVGCDNELPEEIFQKTVLINQNGFLDYPLAYTINSTEIDTMIAVAVSGTSVLKNDIVVDLKVNPDTLDGYNWEKFRYDEILFHDLLPQECYSFNGDGIVIKAGTEYTSIPIKFYLDKIDKMKDYVLPISITSTSGYQIAAAKRSTVLMHILLSNFYSGTYDVSAKLKEEGFDDVLDVRMKRSLKVEDSKTCYMYLGNINENNASRDLYHAKMHINDDNTLTFTPLNKDQDIVADAPSLVEKQERNCVTVVRTQDVFNSHKFTEVTTFYVNYTYKDLSIPDAPIIVRWDGTLSRTKIVYEK